MLQAATVARPAITAIKVAFFIAVSSNDRSVAISGRPALAYVQTPCRPRNMPPDQASKVGFLHKNRPIRTYLVKFVDVPPLDVPPSRTLSIHMISTLCVPSQGDTAWPGASGSVVTSRRNFFL
jgi:hypothetical protein